MTSADYTVETFSTWGKYRRIPVTGRNADATASKESKRRTIVYADVFINDHWRARYIKGYRISGNLEP